VGPCSFQRKLSVWRFKEWNCLGRVWRRKRLFA